MSTEPYAGAVQRDARARAAAKLPCQCPRCGGMVTAEMVWHADHWPISRAEAKLAGIPLAELDVWPAHGSCNTSHNTRPGQTKTAGPRGKSERAHTPIREVSRPAIGTIS